MWLLKSRRPLMGRALVSAGVAGSHWGMPCTTGLSRLNKQIKSNVAAQVGRLEGLECEVDQLQNVLQSVASELESGHQQAQVSLLCTKQQSPGQLYARSCKYVTMEVTEPGSPASEWISECRLVLAWLQQLHAQKLPCCVVNSRKLFAVTGLCQCTRLQEGQLQMQLYCAVTQTLSELNLNDAHLILLNCKATLPGVKRLLFGRCLTHASIA